MMPAPSLAPVTKENTAADLPHNLEAEQAILGALLASESVVNLAIGKLIPQHFFEPVHRRICEAIFFAIEHGHPATPVGLMPQFSGDSGLTAIGGADYLFRLADSAVISSTNVADYIAHLIDLHKRRSLILACTDLIARASTEFETPMERVLGDAIANVVSISETDGSQGRTALWSAVDVAIEASERAYRGESTSIMTGISSLDRVTGGFRPGTLTFLAARPGMGKTGLATTILSQMAMRGIKSALFSLEMTRREIANRMLAAATRINLESIEHGKLTQHDFNRLMAARATMAQWPVHIDDNSGLTIESIMNRARAHVMRDGVQILVIDHLQRLRSQRQQKSRYELVTEITGALKDMAKSLGVPVLCLSQLSREVEKRSDKRPTLADLRDSGSIEQDADVVLFLYRESYYRTDDTTSPTTTAEPAEIMVAKNRNGRAPLTAFAQFTPAFAAFDLDQAPPEIE